MLMAKTKKTKKNVPKKQIKQTKTDTSNKVLLIIFLILCVVVFVLATIMITENANSKNNKYDIKVPITQEELADEINIKINMDDVEKNHSKEYRIQLTNYVDNIINNKIMKYKMELSTSNKKDKVDIELYSNKDNFELLEGKKKVDGLSIKKDKKMYWNYKIEFRIIEPERLFDI